MPRPLLSALLLASSVTLLAASAAAQALPEPPPPPPHATPPPAAHSPTAADLPPPPPPPAGPVEDFERPGPPAQERTRVRVAASPAPQPRLEPDADAAPPRPIVLRPAVLTLGLVTASLAGVAATVGTSALVYECDRHPVPVNGTGCPGEVGDIGRALVTAGVLGHLAAGAAVFFALDLDAPIPPDPPARAARGRREILIGAGAAAVRWSF